MLKTQLLLLADDVVIDHEMNRISVFNIFEATKLLSFPALLPRVAAVASFTRASGDPTAFDLRIKLQLNDQDILSQEGIVQFHDRLSARVIFRMIPVPISGPGTMRFTIRDAVGSILGEYHFRIEGSEAQTVMDGGNEGQRILN